jgi:hypothetical protein
VDNNTYINILTDTLVKKNALLDELILITVDQQTYLDEEPPNMEKFEDTLSEKDKLITRLFQLDEGFESIYEHVRDEISNNKTHHKDQILRLQQLIKQVTEKSAKLQTYEIKNKGKIEIYFSDKKNEIKRFKKNSQVATNYYKNVADQRYGESYFLDKKK